MMSPGLPGRVNKYAPPMRFAERPRQLNVFPHRCNFLDDRKLQSTRLWRDPQIAKGQRTRPHELHQSGKNEKNQSTEESSQTRSNEASPVGPPGSKEMDHRRCLLDQTHKLRACHVPP